MVNVDRAKRRRVMARSRALGHCICDPRRPCPCDVFTTDGYCPCAGEKPPLAPADAVRLTEWVRAPGCASKIPAADLRAMLGGLPAVHDPRVLSGVAAGEDAAIVQLTADLCLIQTVDVMTPCVDDPQAFGRICAANCLSDIYAMGGEPATALSVVAFPSDSLDPAVVTRMLAGAMQVFEQAGVALVGGHSVKDAEIKLGFAITGTIDGRTAIRQQNARAGDALVLTKPLGVGVLAFARQLGRAPAEACAVAERCMATLNREAARAMRAAGASACTDVTGFGLFVHLSRLLGQAGAAAVVSAPDLPALPAVLDLLRDGVVPGSVERNLESVGPLLNVEPGVEEAFIHLGLDAQTSGGLLIAVAPDRLPDLRRQLESHGVAAAVIGQVVPGPAGRVTLARAGQPTAVPIPVTEVPWSRPPPRPAAPAPEAPPMPASDPSVACCNHDSPTASTGTTAASSQAFGAFMRTVAADGAVPARTKQLMLFALVLLARCEPCVAAHLAKARQMGLTQAELDEAAWCAIAIGGGPVKMLYDRALSATGGKGQSCC